MKTVEAIKNNENILNWMDSQLTFKLIEQRGITDTKEITAIKLAIWDFLAAFEEKVSI